MKVIVEQVDKLLGHDSISYILQNVVTALGIPKTYLFEEQAHLLVCNLWAVISYLKAFSFKVGGSVMDSLV